MTKNAYLIEARQGLTGFLIGLATTFTIQVTADRPFIAIPIGTVIMVVIAGVGSRRRRRQQAALGRVLSESSSSTSAFELVEYVGTLLADGVVPADAVSSIDFALTYRRHPHTSLLSPIRSALTEPSSTGSTSDTVALGTDMCQLTSAWRRRVRESVVETIAKYVGGLGSEVVLVLYGYSSTVCDGLASCSDRRVPSIIVVEDVQYGSASVGEHVETKDHLHRAGLPGSTIAFETVHELIAGTPTTIPTLEGGMAQIPGAATFVAMIGCDAFDDRGRSFIPAVFDGITSESAKFVEMFQPSEHLSDRVRLVMVAESYKAVRDLGELNPLTYSPAREPWWIGPLHRLGFAVPFKGEPVRLFETDEQVSVYLTDDGTFERTGNDFNLRPPRDLWQSHISATRSIPPLDTDLPIGRTTAETPAGSPLDAVMFDCNGVLVNDEPIHFQAFASLADSTTGHRLTWTEYVAGCKGKTDREGVRYLLSRLVLEGDEAELLAAKAEAYREGLSRPEDLVFPGVHQLLARLSDRGIPMGIVTASDAAWLEDFLDRAGLGWAFDSDHLRTDVSYPKRYRAMASLLSDLGGRADRTLLVDDSDANLQLGLGLGVMRVGVQSAGNEALDAGQWLVRGVGEIVDLIDWGAPTEPLFLKPYDA